MRICVTVEGQEDVSWRDWLAIARTCERCGFEGLFRSDHYGSVFDFRRGSLDAWATIAALGAATAKIRLGSLVSPATFRHPSELARIVATADHVSGGRVELGLGAGWLESEHRAFGFPFPTQQERLERFAEQLEIIHRQWTEDIFDFDGNHYVLTNCSALPKPVQAPHPPLIVGGVAYRGTTIPAVHFADEYNTHGASPDVCLQRRARLDAACKSLGRDPATLPMSVMTPLVLGADRREVRARANDLARRMGRRSADELIGELEQTAIIGTPPEAIERLHEYEASGVTRVFLQNFSHDDIGMLELIAGEVLPAFI